MTETEAVELLQQFLSGTLQRTPGWDQRVASAMLTAAGGINRGEGRRRLVKFALAEQEGRAAKKS
jgi:hypothetical protein